MTSFEKYVDTVIVYNGIVNKGNMRWLATAATDVAITVKGTL